MKRLIKWGVLFMLIACLAFSSVGFAEQTNDSSSASDYKTTEEYLLVKRFCANYPNRNNQGNEIAVARGLVKEFEKIDGLEVSLQTGVNVVVEQTTYQSANVVAKLDTPSSKSVVIGAHFDNNGVGEGASDNAVGVVTMYLLAKKLAAVKSSLPCDIYFVAFGGEEQGLYGSKYFVDHMQTNGDLGNVLVMFNFDSLGVGDNLYVQCENKSTDLEKYLLSMAKDTPCALQVKPYAAGISAIADSFGYGYYESTQGSDHTPFRLKGIPTAFFFSGNFTRLDGYTESTNAEHRISNTSQDTFENLDKYAGERFVNNMQTVQTVVFDALTTDLFMGVATDAKSQLINITAAYGIVPSLVLVGLALAAVIVVLGLRVKYSKGVQRSTPFTSANATDSGVFVKPDVSDVFDLGDDDDVFDDDK